MNAIISVVTSMALTWLALWSMRNVDDWFDAYDTARLTWFWATVWIGAYLMMTLFFFIVILFASVLLLDAAFIMGFPEIICAIVFGSHLIFCDLCLINRRR